MERKSGANNVSSKSGANNVSSITVYAGDWHLPKPDQRTFEAMCQHLIEVVSEELLDPARGLKEATDRTAQQTKELNTRIRAQKSTMALRRRGCYCLQERL